MIYFKYIVKQKTPALGNRSLLQSFCQSKHLNTIYALSTGLNSAISIIRISGPESFKVLSLLNQKQQIQNYSRQQTLSKFNIKPKMMKLCNLYGKGKGIIDKGMIVFFQKNHSYSGQDMFQLHLHGSKAVISAIFSQLSQLDFTIAKRGQFTRRALMNNKMNIQQAQAIHDLISSQLQFQRQIAINNLLGKNKKFIEQLRLELLEISSLVQAYIQFEQNEVGNHIFDDAKISVSKIIEKVHKILQASEKLQKAKDGIRISILGKPNVGKSTLINNLLKKNVAIVSSIPGTTRDLIQGSFIFKGYKIIVMDTAGIRQPSCEIEAQGIRRSKYLSYYLCNRCPKAT